MRTWESEVFVLNLETGEMMRTISPHYFQGVNFEQAQQSLVKSGLKHVRLTGNWFIGEQQPQTLALPEHSNELIDELDEAYLDLIDPRELVKDMSLDDFIDWLNISDELEDILATMQQFVRAGMKEHVQVIVGHLGHKYNYKAENGLT